MPARKPAMAARLRRAVERLGAPGLVGAAILATCLGYYGGSLQPLAHKIESLRALQAPGAAPRARVPQEDLAETLRQFSAAFPAESEVAGLLKQLYGLGERAGLRLTQGEYRYVAADALGMVQYRVTLPVNGRYPSIRQFLGAALAEVPWASVTQVHLQRERVGDGRIDARIELTLHLRAGGASVAGTTATTEPFAVAAEQKR